MRFRLASVTSVLCAAVFGTFLTAHAPAAHAQAALDDDDAKPASTTSSDDDASTAEEAKIGVGLRLRQTWVPKSIIELFVDKAAGGASDFGFGGELFRRKGNFEVQFGLEYESLTIQKGIWVQKGQDPSNGGADRVRFDGFGWVTAEVTFLNHTPINKYFAIRYGGGAGIGVLLGKVRRTDVTCTTTDAAQATDQNCLDTPMPNSDTPYNLPPVFPVINAIIGVQVRPTDNIVINIEGGIRTIPFFGATLGYMF
jgi:hypothetical protein